MKIFSGTNQRRVLSLVWAVSAACATTGCLAFKDFELVETSNGEGGDPSQEPIDEPSQPCSGPFECVDRVLRSCEEGERTRIANCGDSGKWCNADLGACTECRAGIDTRCVSNMLQTCSPQGEFVTTRDCADDNMYCTDAKKECVPCISGNRYCGERGPDDDFDQRYTCVDFAIPKTSVDCVLGCVETENGQGDCAECSVAGGLYCELERDGGVLLRCPESRRNPTVEQECPYGCDPDATKPECYPEP